MLTKRRRLKGTAWRGLWGPSVGAALLRVPSVGVRTEADNPEQVELLANKVALPTRQSKLC
eukprot:12905594-Prorocentrum_lima.AAC.1